MFVLGTRNALQKCWFRWTRYSALTQICRHSRLTTSIRNWLRWYWTRSNYKLVASLSSILFFQKGSLGILQKIFRISHAFLGILSVTYHYFFLNLGSWLLPQKTCYYPVCILLFIDYFLEWKGPGCKSGKCVEYFMHIVVIYHLFTMVCFGTLGVGCYPRNVLGSFLYIGVFYWLFDTIFWKMVW